MDLVVRQTESYLYFHGAFGSIDSYTPTAVPVALPVPVEVAIANATALLSRELRVRGIFVLCCGRTLAVMAAARPAAPIVAVGSRPEDRARACLTWGAIPVLAAEPEAAGSSSELVQRLARELSLAEPGEPVLVIRGFDGEVAARQPSVTVVRL